MKILILGGKRSGKDTLAKVWNNHFGVRFKSATELACDYFIFDQLKDKYGYNTHSECVQDRVNHRKEWADLFDKYNEKDLSRFAKEVLKVSDIYVGMRSFEQVEKCISERIFDLIIWVESDRVEQEKESMTAKKSQANVIIQNNFSRDFFIYNAIILGRNLFN